MPGGMSEGGPAAIRADRACNLRWPCRYACCRLWWPSRCSHTHTNTCSHAHLDQVWCELTACSRTHTTACSHAPMHQVWCGLTACWTPGSKAQLSLRRLGICAARDLVLGIAFGRFCRIQDDPHCVTAAARESPQGSAMRQAVQQQHAWGVKGPGSPPAWLPGRRPRPRCTAPGACQAGGPALGEPG